MFKNSKYYITKKMQKYFDKKYQKLCWNGILEFYTSTYIFLSLIGWMSLYDLRFGPEYTHTERFSSLFGICLFVYSIVFPMFYCGLLIRKYKLMQPILSEAEYEAKLKAGTLRKYLDQFHTEGQRQKYLKKYAD